MDYCKAHQLDCNGFCNRFDAPCIKKNCRFFGVKTNADRIRSMSDKELAEFLADRFSNENCNRLSEDHLVTAIQIEAIRHTWYCCWMKWLKQPAEE